MPWPEACHAPELLWKYDQIAGRLAHAAHGPPFFHIPIHCIQMGNSEIGFVPSNCLQDSRFSTSQPCSPKPTPALRNWVRSPKTTPGSPGPAPQIPVFPHSNPSHPKGKPRNWLRSVKLTPTAAASCTQTNRSSHMTLIPGRILIPSYGLGMDPRTLALWRAAGPGIRT